MTNLFYIDTQPYPIKSYNQTQHQSLIDLLQPFIVPVDTPSDLSIISHKRPYSQISESRCTNNYFKGECCVEKCHHLLNIGFDHRESNALFRQKKSNRYFCSLECAYSQGLNHDQVVFALNYSLHKIAKNIIQTLQLSTMCCFLHHDMFLRSIYCLYAHAVKHTIHNHQRIDLIWQQALPYLKLLHLPEEIINSHLNSPLTNTIQIRTQIELRQQADLQTCDCTEQPHHLVVDYGYDQTKFRFFWLLNALTPSVENINTHPQMVKLTISDIHHGHLILIGRMIECQSHNSKFINYGLKLLNRLPNSLGQDDKLYQFCPAHACLKTSENQNIDFTDTLIN